MLSSTSRESVPQQKSVSLYNYIDLPSVSKGIVCHKVQMSLSDDKGPCGILYFFSAGVCVCMQNYMSIT